MIGYRTDTGIQVIQRTAKGKVNEDAIRLFVVLIVCARDKGRMPHQIEDPLNWYVAVNPSLI